MENVEVNIEHTPDLLPTVAHIDELCVTESGYWSMWVSLLNIFQMF